jgi:hypothetical protein
MLRPAALVVLALALGCSSDALEIDEVAVSEDGDLGKADGANETKVRVGGTSLWVRNQLAVDDGVLVLHGRTSRNLVDGNAFVFDDPYGDFAIASARTFDVTWPVSTARGLLDGVDLFVGLDFVHSETRPDHLTSHVVVRPRLTGFSGSSQVYLVAPLTPRLVEGRVVYRLIGTAQSFVFGADARAGDTNLGIARVVDDETFELDIEPSVALELVAAETPITVRVQLESGDAEKTATLGVALHDLGFTEGDASETWPNDCADDTLVCLTALPAGTQDLASCGDARTVMACSAEIGGFVGEDEVDALLMDMSARLADENGLVAHAPALVGADRVDVFFERARDRLVADLEAVHGRWFLDDTARDAALDAVVEAAFDDVYAFPLVGFDQRPPVPGDVAATRQLVADALLGYLAQQDYYHSEFSRSYVELAHEFRAQHVESLRVFREEVAREDYPGMPTLDVYVSDWLGAYTEVSVDKTTGAVTNVYVELD